MFENFINRYQRKILWPVIFLFIIARVIDLPVHFKMFPMEFYLVGISIKIYTLPIIVITKYSIINNIISDSFE